MENLSAEIRRTFRKGGITEESLKISSDLKARNSIFELAFKSWHHWHKKVVKDPFNEVNNVARNVIIGLQISADVKNSLSPDGMI